MRIPDKWGRGGVSGDCSPFRGRTRQRLRLAPNFYLHPVASFISHYIPGYKSGGPVKSIYNLSEHLNKYFDFLIVTSDRDLKDKKLIP